MTTRYPKLVAFDLDYTLWDLWIDTHVTGPLRREGDAVNKILDAYDQPISLYREVPQILHRLKFAGVTLAACSRTCAPRLARQALSLLLVPPSKAEPDDEPTSTMDFFDQLEIYPGSKITHFKELHKKTGIPYSEMLFFDDEHRNSEVERLGVTFCLIRHELDEQTFEHGLADWRWKHSEPVSEESEQSEEVAAA